MHDLSVDDHSSTARKYMTRCNDVVLAKQKYKTCPKKSRQDQNNPFSTSSDRQWRDRAQAAIENKKIAAATNSGSTTTKEEVKLPGEGIEIFSTPDQTKEDDAPSSGLNIQAKKLQGDGVDKVPLTSH